MCSEVAIPNVRDLEYADLSLTYTEESPDYRILAWTARYSLEDDESVEPTEIFTMDGFDFLYPERGDAPLSECLDTIDQDTANMAALASLDGPWLSDEAESFAGIGSSLVIVSRAALISDLRGRGGVGRYLSARTIDLVARSAGLVALTPYPIELAEDAPKLAVRRGVKEITRLWATLGFEPFSPSPDVMVLPVERVNLRSTAERFLESVASRAKQADSLPSPQWPRGVP